MDLEQISINCNHEYIPINNDTINVVLFCDIDNPTNYDLVIFWLSYINNHYKHFNSQNYKINFDYETNLNMDVNKYKLRKNPTIRIIYQKYCIEYANADISEDNWTNLINVIEQAINLLIKLVE